MPWTFAGMVSACRNYIFQMEAWMWLKKKLTMYSECGSGSSCQCEYGSFESGSCRSGSCEAGSAGCGSGSCESRFCASGSCESGSCDSESCVSGFCGPEPCESGSWSSGSEFRSGVSRSCEPESCGSRSTTSGETRRGLNEEIFSGLNEATKPTSCFPFGAGSDAQPMFSSPVPRHSTPRPRLVSICQVLSHCKSYLCR